MLLTPERTEEIRTRIQAAVENALRERAVSARRASLDVVGNDGLIRDIRAGRLPGVDRLEALFEYLGLEFYLGPRRKAEHTGFAEDEASMTGYQEHGADQAYLDVSWHPQSPRPGGYANAPVKFARSWLDQSGLDASRLVAVLPRPKSGRSEIVALLDPAAVRSGGPSTWCYRDNGQVAMGRVQFDRDVTLILPEDPDEPARVLIGDERAKLPLLGRVVWSGRLHPDNDPAGSS